MSTVAFIGLGHMGGGMAANLAAKGFTVQAFDLVPEAVERAVEAGCTAAASASEAVKGAEAVVTMLPAGKFVADVYHDTVFANAAPGTLLIDCSTIDVATAQKLASEAEAAGFPALDAPVSGGIAAAAAGTLTFMVGGTDAGYKRAGPVLQAMGNSVIRAGDHGAGQTAKICNNMLLGASMVATAEAFLLAQKLGLDPQRFYDISSVSSGQCWSMTSYCPLPGVGPESPADKDYEGGFAVPLMLKDLRLAAEAAVAAGQETPMGAKALLLYQELARGEWGQKDFSVIIKALADAG